MSLENGTYISDLVKTNPTGTDPKSQGDDHLRLIKACVQQSFPNINAPVTAAPADLNSIAGKVNKAGDTMTGQLDGITPIAASNLTRKDYVDGFLNKNLAGQIIYESAFCNNGWETKQNVGAGFATRIIAGSNGVGTVQFVDVTGTDQRGFLTSDGANNLYVQSAGALRLRGVGAFAEIQGNDATSPIRFLNGGSTLLSYIDNNNGNYVVVSDARLKENVTGCSKGLDTVLSLRPVEYTMIADEVHNPQLGFIAQEVQPVIPEAVSQIDNQYFMNHTVIIPVLVKAIQELSAEVAALKAAK